MTANTSALTCRRQVVESQFACPQHLQPIEQRGRTLAQIALRWLLDQPYITTVPKASSHERRLENFQVFDFHLSDADRERIAALPKDVRTANPGWAPDWSD